MLNKIKLSNKAYDVLKVIALVIVPLTVLIGSLGDIWGLPYREQIVKTLAAIDLFVGSLLEVSSINYNKSKELEKE